MDARRTTSKDKVTPYNDVCFKSPFGQFLQVEAKEQDIIFANGLEINPACMFKIVKAGVPNLPDWLFKRPHLNHNSITSTIANLIEIKPQKTLLPKALGSFPLEI